LDLAKKNKRYNYDPKAANMATPPRFGVGTVCILRSSSGKSNHLRFFDKPSIVKENKKDKTTADTK